MFEKLETLPPDPILGVAVAFREDRSPDKVDLSIGVYKDRSGVTPVMRAVQKAERALIEAQDTKVYLPPSGAPGSARASSRSSWATVRRPQVARRGDPGAGGCGALRLGAELIHRAAPAARVLMSDPTWPNHGPLLSGAGCRPGSIATSTPSRTG